jgi:DNA-binding GntR family transcriptional regulator
VSAPCPAAGVSADTIKVTPLTGRESLREQVIGALRAAVITGEMQPGRVYSAPSLAARFHVSATPVREALLDLTKEGLVESVRNKGFRVTEVTDKQLDDITELRALIEVPMVTRIASGITARQVRAMRPLADAICVAAEEGDLIGYIEADRRFHLALLELTGNAQVVGVVDELRGKTRLYGLARLVEQRALAGSAQEHHEILDALEANDPARTEDVMRRHIGHVRGLWSPGASSEADALG